MADRPSLDQYFMDMTQLVKARGTCPRRQVGAVVVKDKRVLTTGYNGAPRNFPHPIDTGCLRDELGIPRGMLADVCPCLHAEQNAILQAATTGVSIEGSDLFCTTQPCTQCSRMIANAGIKRVCFAEEYPDPLAIGILTTAGVESWMWDAETKVLLRYGNTNTFEQAQDALRAKWQAERPELVPRSPLLETPAPGTEDEGEGGPPGAGVRDLRDAPDRQEVIRRMAREKAQRMRLARESARMAGPGAD